MNRNIRIRLLLNAALMIAIAFGGLFSTSVEILPTAFTWGFVFLAIGLILVLNAML